MIQPATPAPPLSEQLRQHRIFGLLSEGSRQRLADTLVVQSLEAGEALEAVDAAHPRLYWLLSGAMTLLDAQAQPVVTLQPGELFGLQAARATGVQSAQARTPSELVSLDSAQVEELRGETPALGYLLHHLDHDSASALGTADTRSVDPALNLMTTPVRAIIRREPITLPPRPASAKRRRS